MNQKHTPGPWSVDHADGYFIITDSPDAYGSVAHLADRPNQHGQFRDDTDEVKANARLISAAPELLVALKAMEAASQSGSCTEMLAAGIIARAAIAKAEGRDR